MPSERAGNELDEGERAELEQLRTILTSNLTFREIEAKIRDGQILINSLSSDEDTTTHACLRWIAAMCLHILLGDENVEPDNYRSCEFHLKTAGEYQGWRLIAEIVKPGGKSSHEIRRQLEAQLERAQRGGEDTSADGSLGPEGDS